jgi:hypothetical protein
MMVARTIETQVDGIALDSIQHLDDLLISQFNNNFFPRSDAQLVAFCI